MTFTSVLSPFFTPTRPSSKPGMKRLEPSFNGWSLPAPPSNSSPSMLPTKSMIVVSPISAFLPSFAGTVGTFSSPMRCNVSSTSASSTDIVGRSTAIFAKSGKAISGMTSHFRMASISPPSSYFSISTDGWLARRKELPSIASFAPSSSAVRITSPLAWSPKRAFTTDAGTLPGRKPGIFAVCANSANFASIFASISAAVTTIEYSRSRPSLRVSVIFMNVIPVICLLIFATPILRLANSQGSGEVSVLEADGAGGGT